MKTITLALTLLGGLGAVSESPSQAPPISPPPARLVFRANGFAIDALDRAPGEASTQVLTMTLPTTDAFAPNVMVQILPYTGTVEEYFDLIGKQFVSLGVKMLHDRKQGAVMFWEYSGPVKSVITHGYVRAEKKGDKIYLATALSMESQWPAVSSTLKACVESFRANPVPEIAGARPE